MRWPIYLILALGLVLLVSGLPYASPAFAEPVALKSQWTDTSRLYQSGPNSFVLDASVSAINFKAPWKGVTDWREINPGWEPAAAPWDYRSSSAFAEYDVKAKTDITAGQVIEWEKDGSTVALQPHALNWSNDLDQLEQVSMPQSGALFSSGARRLGWLNAYGGGIDLFWTLDNTRLKKELIIAGGSLPAPPAFIIAGGNPVLELNFILAFSTDLDLFVNGAIWDKKAQIQTLNTVEFRRGADTFFIFAKPSARDSSLIQSPVAPTFTLKKQGAKLFISVRVSKGWLDTAIYPVTIDPTLDLQVGADSDDLRVNDGTSAQTSGFITGNSQFATGPLDSGARFTNVTIPPGSTIDVAHLTLTPNSTQTDQTILANILGEDSDNAVTFTGTAADFVGRTRTTAFVTHDVTDTWTLDVEENLPSMVSVAQEIVDRSGWASGNAQIYFWEDDGSDAAADSRLESYQHDDNNAKAPKLHIEYTEPPVTNAYWWSMAWWLIPALALIRQRQP